MNESRLSRRDFLRWSGAGAASIALAACERVELPYLTFEAAEAAVQGIITEYQEAYTAEQTTVGELAKALTPEQNLIDPTVRALTAVIGDKNPDSVDVIPDIQTRDVHGYPDSPIAELALHVMDPEIGSVEVIISNAYSRWMMVRAGDETNIVGIPDIDTSPRLPALPAIVIPEDQLVDAARFVEYFPTGKQSWWEDVSPQSVWNEWRKRVALKRDEFITYEVPLAEPTQAMLDTVELMKKLAIPGILDMRLQPMREVMQDYLFQNTTPSFIEKHPYSLVVTLSDNNAIFRRVLETAKETHSLNLWESSSSRWMSYATTNLFNRALNWDERAWDLPLPEDDHYVPANPYKITAQEYAAKFLPMVTRVRQDSGDEYFEEFQAGFSRSSSKYILPLYLHGSLEEDIVLPGLER